MTTSLAFWANTRVSLIDLPRADDDIFGTDACEHGRRAEHDQPRDQRERADRCRLHSDWSE
jgi:hypothetical protein